MKILWITNIPIAEMAQQLQTKGGLWMDALLSQLIDRSGYSFVVVTSWNVEKVVFHRIGKVSYYLVPGGAAGQYKRDFTVAKNEWIQLLNNEKPDVMQIWGSENAHVLPAIKAAKDRNIPCVVYIQGILKSIIPHACGHVPFGTMLRYTTIRDFYRRQVWFKQDKWFTKRAKIEEKTLSSVDCAIVENQWAEHYCKSINPGLSFFRIPLSINEEFKSVKWSFDKMIPHTIICNASGYAYKGLHVLLEALTSVKKRYPDVKLYIPGRSMIVGKGSARQKSPGYWVYISDYIRENKLNDNVVFTGYLSPKELAERLSVANVFVLSSAIENHSSSLKEAMAVGTPSVAAMVGGVPEYFFFNETGFSYRYGEAEILAGYICDLFENRDLCERFSINGRKRIEETDDTQIGSLMESMYQELKERCK